MATGVIVDPDTPQAYLVVEVTVDCPECGPAVIRIPGHHLKTLRDICQSYCDQFPALTGGAVTLVNTYGFEGVAPWRPEDHES